MNDLSTAFDGILTTHNRAIQAIINWGVKHGAEDIIPSPISATRKVALCVRHLNDFVEEDSLVNGTARDLYHVYSVHRHTFRVRWSACSVGFIRAIKKYAHRRITTGHYSPCVYLIASKHTDFDLPFYSKDDYDIFSLNFHIYHLRQT